MNNEPLNPNDPDVYADPEKVRQLPPSDQMIAIINLAKTGQVVQGNEVLTMEAMLREAGYPSNMDGQFSAEEMAAMQHLKDQMEDKQFKDAANTLADMIKDAVCDKAIDALITPDHLQNYGMTPQQSAAVKFVAKLVI